MKLILWILIRYKMKEMLYTLLGSIIAIIVTWIFNLITNKRQHKMEIQRLAVQNKLETSKKAISWLLEAKNELYVVVWSLEHLHELAPGMLGGVAERAEKLTTLEVEAKNYFNAIELYYNFDAINKKYNLESIIPHMLSLLNTLAALRNIPQEVSVENFDGVLKDTLSALKQLRSAVEDIIEIIRQDNLSYLK